MKYINFKRYKFSTIFKNIDLSRYKLSKIYKYIDPRRYNFSKSIKYIDPRRYNFSKSIKYIDPRRYNWSKLYKFLDLNRFKKTPLYFAEIVFFSILFYLSMPFFYNYDKSNIEKRICDNLNINCSIKGNISYNFFPSPRIIIRDFIIKDLIDKKKIIGSTNRLVIKLSFYNLHDKKKIKHTKIDLNEFEFIFDFKNLKRYQNFFEKRFSSKPINIKKGVIKFFDGEKYIVAIEDVNFRYVSSKNRDKSILNGKFLGDNIYLEMINKKKSSELSKILILKLSDLKVFTKAEIFNSKDTGNTISGNILFKKDKNRLTGKFDYNNGKFVFRNGNLRNLLLDGQFAGEVEFLPFFNFNLDVVLKGINFNKLHSNLISFDGKNQKNLFKINRKINGNLDLSADKIYSKYNLIDSFESKIQFINGNIVIEKMLLNLGKLGAADITGVIKNDEKHTNLKFQNNIFIDNLKRFYNKFGVFNKQKTSSELFVEGNFDLANYNMHFSEIHYGQKLNDEDVSYIQKEFNEILLEEKYKSLFNFPKFKEFVKSITTE